MKNPLSNTAMRRGVWAVFLLMLVWTGSHAQNAPPSLGVAMRAEDPIENEQGSYTVVYEIVIRNYGTAPLTDLNVVDNLSIAFADAADFRVIRVESKIAAVNEDYDGVEDVALLAAGADLGPGTEETITVEVTVNPGDRPGRYESTVVATAFDPEGQEARDASQNGLDPDPDGNGDPRDNNQPTPVMLGDTPLIGFSKELVSKTANGDGSYTLVYEFLLKNYGNVSLKAIQAEEDLLVAFASPALCEVKELTSDDLHVNEEFDGADDIRLLTGEDSLRVGETARVTLTVCMFRKTTVDTYYNSATASGRGPAGDLVTDVSQEGANPDPDGDGDPGNDDVPTAASFARIEHGGALDTTISLTDGEITVDVIALNTYLSIEGFTTQLQTTFSNTGMDTFGVTINGTVGNIRLNSSITFDPSTVSFVSWQGGVAFTLLDLDVTSITYLGAPQTNSYTQFSFSGSADDISAQATVRFGVCPLEFWALNACATWEWSECDTAINGCVLFTAEEGFSSATLSLSDLVLVEDVFGLQGQGLLDVTFTYTVDEKVFSPRLRFEPDWRICAELELLGEVTMSSLPLGVEGILVYGLVGEVTLANDVTFSFAESFHDEKDASVTGKAGYGGILKVGGPAPSCCDTPGTFELATYFGGTPSPSGSLLGIGLFTASFDLRMFEGFSIAFDGEYPTNGTGWSFAVTVGVFW
jgi:hypothetical protein